MFKEELLSALKEAAAHHNDGMSDNDAVIKAADAKGFNAEQTQRLVETYNTAKTVSFYKHASDRSLAFDLADSGVVLKSLFKAGTSRTTPESPVLQDYTCYEQPMIFSEEEMGKAASVETEEKRPLTDMEIRAALNDLDDIKRAQDNCQTMMNTAAYRRQQHLDTFILDASSLDLRKEAATYAAVACGEYKDLADYVANLLRVDVEHIKDAEFSDFDVIKPLLANEFRRAVDCEETYRSIKKSAALIAEAEKTASNNLSEILGMVDAQTRDEADFAKDFFTEEAQVAIEFGGLNLNKQAAKSEAAGMDPLAMVGQSVSKGTTGFGSELVQNVLEGASEKARTGESKLLGERAKNLHRKFMLEDLMTTDPVLKGVDPDAVISTYDSIVKLAPEVSLNKEVVRSVLRSATNAAAVSPFDAKALVDLDKAIQEQRGVGGATKKPKKD